MNLRRRTRNLFGSRSLSFIFSFILLFFQRMDFYMHLKINTDEIKRKVTTVVLAMLSAMDKRLMRCRIMAC